MLYHAAHKYFKINQFARKHDVVSKVNFLSLSILPI